MENYYRRFKEKTMMFVIFDGKWRTIIEDLKKRL